MEQIKCNVVIGNKRTSVTINVHVLELLAWCFGTPSPQDLVNVSEESGFKPQGNMSNWVTSLIAAEAISNLSKYREWEDAQKRV